MKNIIIIFFFIFFFQNNTYASTKNKILQNFEKINNFSFDFKQTIAGKDERGSCVIQYPKKIYCKYKLKHKKILVSNGKSLVIKSYKNESYYRYNLKSTPLNLILDKSFIIEKIKKSEVREIDEKYYIFSVSDNDNIINFFFDNKSYNLIGWQTEDMYQNLSVTFIYDIKINQEIEPKLFKLPKMF